MARGAPQGNQYAKKSTRRRGITVSYYVRADIYEFLKECLQFETGDDSEEAIRQRVNDITEKAINQEMRRIFALYKSSREDEERTNTVETATKFSTILENYLTSDDFKDGVISSTRASWGGSGYSVELFEDGTWHNLWNNQVGNRYESEGIILRLPTLDTDDMQQYIDDGAGTEDDFLAEAFENEREELIQSMRSALTDKE